ncbi:hypothetical protein Tco_1315624 [Tanacetum coccineum]
MFFVPQQELSDEQAIWLQTSHPNTDQSASLPVKIEAPRELPKTYKQLYDSIKPSCVRAKEQTESLVNQVNQKSVEISYLNAQFQEKVFVITALKNDLRKLKGKEIADNAATITPGMYKLDPVILSPKVKNNMKAHEYYLKHTMEQAAILRELIQELLGYVRDTFPDIHKPSEKLVVVTPINKKKTVRFADTITSSGNIPKVTNKPLLSSTRVNPMTSASRKVKSSLNKRNSDSKNVCNEHVKHPVNGAKALCSACNKCFFDANHAMCLIDHVNSMNMRAKSASKKNKKRKEWKPTGKVFNSVGYKWKPTGRTFHLVEMVAQSMAAKRMEPGTSQGSDTSVSPSSSSLIDCRLSKLFCGNITISRVYYVEGLGHNLFSVGQFCDSDLEVAFQKYTCFVRNLEGVDLLSRS